MGKNIRYFLCGLLVLAAIQSCVEELNFDQLDNLKIRPVLEGSIMYVEATENVINRAASANFYTQKFNFDGFSEAFFADRVIDGVVTYYVENTTSKDLNITVEFVDESGAVLDVEYFNIAPAPPIEPILREIPYGGTGRDLNILKSTNALRVTASNNGDTSSVSSLENPIVIIKSSGKFTLSVK